MLRTAAGQRDPDRPSVHLLSPSPVEGDGFPTEAALLEAFLATFDVLGCDNEGSGVNPFFVAWILDPPADGGAEELRAHGRLVELSGHWRSSHPCWDDTLMPFLTDEEPPVEVVARLVGAASDQVMTEALFHQKMLRDRPPDD